MPFTGHIYCKWMRKTQLAKYKDIILDFIIPLKMDFGKMKILDVGIGPGWFEKELEQRLNKKLNVIGIDVDKKAKSGVKLVIADANKVPFKPGIFDFIFCLDSVHLIKKPATLLKLLRPGGYILVSIFCSKYNTSEKRVEIIKYFSGANLLKESVVGDKKLELSYVALFKV